MQATMRFFQKKESVDDGSPTPPPRPRLDQAFKDELRQSVHTIKLKKEKKSIFGFLKPTKRSTSADDSSEDQSNRPRRVISREEADELRKSFHNQNHLVDGHRLLAKKHDPPPLTGRPVLSKDIANELRMSFHNRNAKKEDRRKEFQRILQSNSSSSSDSSEEINFGDNDRLDPPVNEAQHQSDGGRPSMGQRPTLLKSGVRGRPSLSRDMAEELRMSFVNRNKSKYNRRQQIVNRIMQRRESQRMLITPESGDPYMSRPTLGVSRSGDVKSDSKHDGSFHMSGSILKPPTYSTKKSSVDFDFSASSMKSFEDDEDDHDESAHKSPPRRASRATGLRQRLENEQVSPRKALSQSLHSADTFTADFSSDEEDENAGVKVYDWKREPSEKKLRSGGPKRNDSGKSPISPRRELPEIKEGDFQTYKTEWARLVKEKQVLKGELSSSKMETATLKTEMENYRNENEELRHQLSDAQAKISKFSKRQTKERNQFDNSTDLIAQARVDLAKALNDARVMKTRINDFEELVAEKDRRIYSFSENLKSQAETLDDMASRLRDTETEMRYNSEEKRRVEEEFAVLVAAQDGQDITETIRRLEQEKARWLDERERALEARRMALDEENDRMLQRDQNRYRQEADQLMQSSATTREREEENNRLQEEINIQLHEMKDANRSLHEKLNNDHLEMTVEIKEKEHAVAVLQQEVSKLKKKLASRSLEEKGKELRKAEVEATRDHLRDALKQTKLLEKQIAKMDAEMEEVREHANDWREIVLPGHRNLRGVTFGADKSNSLAGFLTILVEEQAKSNTRRSRSSSLSRYVKEREAEKKREKRKKDKKNESRKNASKERARSKSKERKRSESKEKKKSKSKNRDRDKEKEKDKKKEKDRKKERAKEKEKDKDRKKEKDKKKDKDQKDTKKSKTKRSQKDAKKEKDKEKHARSIADFDSTKAHKPEKKKKSKETAKVDIGHIKAHKSEKKKKESSREKNAKIVNLELMQRSEAKKRKESTKNYVDDYPSVIAMKEPKKSKKGVKDRGRSRSRSRSPHQSIVLQ